MAEAPSSTRAAVTLSYRWFRSLVDMPHQPPARQARLAWALLGLTVVLVALSVVIGSVRGQTWNEKFAFIPVSLAFAVMGALVAARTGNRLGWLFLAAATVSAVTVLADAYAGPARTAEPPGAAWVAWAFGVILGIVGPLFWLTPLLFPDGRPPSPRWRPVVWVAILAGLSAALCAALSNVEFSNDFPGLRDPVTVVAPLVTAYNLSQEAGLLVLLAGVISMIVRFRRSGTEQRLQFKWFMYATAIAAVVVFVAGDLTSDPLLEFEIVFPLIPAAVGVAILKYRLYDIDRLISRTLGYAIVTGLLVGLYAGLVLLATHLLSITSPVAVAASTLAAAALFSPLRRRVQRAVDRRFNRVRYDADQTVAAFAARLRDAVDLDAVRSDLVAVVNSAVEPAHISVWTVSGQRLPQRAAPSCPRPSCPRPGGMGGSQLDHAPSSHNSALCAATCSPIRASTSSAGRAGTRRPSRSRSAAWPPAASRAPITAW
jgi:hypothetical protein